MRLKSLILGAILSAIAFSSPVIADSDNGGNHNQSEQPGIKNPEERNDGEKREYRHHIGEDGEHGFEAIQFVLIGGALVVAVALAYNAGKRNRKNKSE